MILAVTRGQLRLLSRNGKDLTPNFPELQALADALLAAGHDDLLLDGELVAAIPGQVPTLGSIATRIQRRHPDDRVRRATPVMYVIFDLLRLDGTDLAPLRYDDRRNRLAALVPAGGPWCVAEQFADGQALWAATAEQGVEGVVAKRRSARYQPGVRSRDWVKAVHRATSELAVIGWRWEPNRSRIGALVVAEPRGGSLVCVGRVGSGMTQRLSDALTPVLAGIRRTTAPLPIPALVDPDGATHWCEPVLVAEVASAGYTHDGQLRAPVLVRLRPDLTAAEPLAGDPR